MPNLNRSIKSRDEVELFLTDLKSILTADNCELDILLKKKSEEPLDPFTTENTLIDLGYDSGDVKNELLFLTSSDYIETIEDSEDLNRPPFWVFAKNINCKGIYIKVKIRNKLTKKVFCISFHYARFPFTNLPYA